MEVIDINWTFSNKYYVEGRIIAVNSYGVIFVQEDVETGLYFEKYPIDGVRMDKIKITGPDNLLVNREVVGWADDDYLLIQLNPARYGMLLEDEENNNHLFYICDIHSSHPTLINVHSMLNTVVNSSFCTCTLVKRI